MDPRGREPSMDPSTDPRVNRPPMSVEAGPSRCHMETSFYNILHSAGFAEWAARAEAQNKRLRSGTPTSRDSPLSSPLSLSDAKPVAEPPVAVTTSRSQRQSKRATRARKLDEAQEKPAKTPSADQEVADDEAEEDGARAGNFPVSYSNYSSMDTELNILTKHLMQHGGC